MSKVSPLSLSDRDKTPAPSGWGHDFHHTSPQRRVPCVLGEMLAPLSADDIPPITPEAMEAVQTAITLLANLVGDPDHGRFLGFGNAKLEEYREKAKIILGMGRSLAGILRVVETSTPLAPALVETYLRRTGWDECPSYARSATFATFRKGLTWLDVPVCHEHFAYPKRFHELLTKLSKIESRPMAMIVDDIVNR